MQGFEEVKLGWGGEEFTVPANQQLMLIAKIEDALSGASNRQAIDVLLQPNGPPMARLAQAYGAALRYAGAEVTDNEVYLSIMSDIAEGNADALQAIQGAVLGLLSIIAPPVAKMLGEDLEKPEKKRKTPTKKKAS